MDVEPAHIDQVVRGRDGRMYEISADVGNVVADLKRIDPKLGVRLSEAARYWHVYCQLDEHTTDLVMSVKAYQGKTGAWLGLDQRVVRRFEKIGHESYDFAKEVDEQNARADRAKREREQSTIAESSDRAGHAFRKAAGLKSRAFIK